MLCKKVLTKPKFIRYFSKGADSNVWLSRQLNDPYVKRSRIESYRCRSAYKLLEINQKYQLLHPGLTVLDCGAAPGSWSQVISRNCFLTENSNSMAIAVDKQFFKPVPNVICFSECDILSDCTTEKIRHVLGERRFDLVLSDMAPNATGIKDIDLTSMISLNEMALKIAVENSKRGASFLCKIWSCEHNDERMKELVLRFYKSFKWIKPPSSRSDSSENFLLARGFRE